MHICMVVQEAILHLPADIAPHSRSHAAFVEVSYGVSWITKGYWQPIWRASSGTGFGDEMHLVFECATMADLRGQSPDIFQAHQTMQQFMWQPNLLQVAKFLDAGMKSQADG